MSSPATTFFLISGSAMIFLTCARVRVYSRERWVGVRALDYVGKIHLSFIPHQVTFDVELK